MLALLYRGKPYMSNAESLWDWVMDTLCSATTYLAYMLGYLAIMVIDLYVVDLSVYGYELKAPKELAIFRLVRSMSDNFVHCRSIPLRFLGRYLRDPVFDRALSGCSREQGLFSSLKASVVTTPKDGNAETAEDDMHDASVEDESGHDSSETLLGDSSPGVSEAHYWAQGAGFVAGQWQASNIQVK